MRLNCKLVVGSYFVIGLWLFVISPALAFPQVFPTQSINGPTGVIRIPSANVVPYKNYNVGANFGTSINRFSSSEGTLTFNLNMGAFNGIELGVVGGTDVDNRTLREGVFVNLKLSLATDDGPNPLLLALGTENLFSRNQADVYMVATKYFKQNLKLTFGFMADFPDNRFRPLGLLGAEFPLGDTFIVGADSMLGESLIQLNAGAKLYFSPLFSVNLYGLNVLNGGIVKDQRSVLLGFSWANPFE